MRQLPLDLSRRPGLTVFQWGADNLVDPSLSVDLGFGDSSPDGIKFQVVSSSASPPATGTFDLASTVNRNTQTCEQCILVYQDFDAANNPQKIFFQSAGTISIDPNTVPGASANIGLSWSGVELSEVTIDTNGVSSSFAGGDCYTIVIDPVFGSGFEAAGS